MMKNIYLLILSGLLFSCAGSPELRQSDILKKRYPDGRYMTAIGMGTDRNMAVDNAYAALATQFNSRVHVDEKVLKRYDAFTDASGYNETISEESITQIRISSSQDLINVRLTESFTNRKNMIYIMAYIPRAATAEILKDRIERNQSLISEYVKMADKARLNVKKFIYYNAAWLVSARNRMMTAQIEVLDRLRVPKKFKYSYARLTTLREFYASRMVFNISIINDNNNRVRQSVAKALTEAGFSVTREAGT